MRGFPVLWNSITLVQTNKQTIWSWNKFGKNVQCAGCDTPHERLTFWGRKFCLMWREIPNCCWAFQSRIQRCYRKSNTNSWLIIMCWIAVVPTKILQSFPMNSSDWVFAIYFYMWNYKPNTWNIKEYQFFVNFTSKTDLTWNWCDYLSLNRNLKLLEKLKKFS